MVRLTPGQQEELLRTVPESFRPAAGAWGRNGSTVVLLSATKVTTLAPIIRLAWANITARK
jgi:hypothetical protein